MTAHASSTANTAVGTPSVVNDPARPKQLCPPETVDHIVCPVQLTSFHPVLPFEVAALCRSLDERKATGHDGLPAVVLKRCADTLAPSLAKLFNVSLSSGTVPSKFKMVNISPLFKGGDVTVASNYRPVSLLPIISRMLEKFVQQRLMSFLTVNMLLPDSQFAYRKNHSTEDAITLAVNRWLLAEHERQTTGIVFVDMSKAFDRVRHDQLVSDLAVIGVRDIVLSWFCDYLSDRLQRVRIGDDHSDYATCSRGVPQGSVSGPLLFVLYIRNLSECLPSAVSNLEYADDIMLEATHSSQATLCQSLSTAVTALAQWLEDRGLLVNDRKTQVMIIQPRGNSASPPPVLRGDKPIPTVHSVRYLGVIVDDGLSWKPHVDSVTKEVWKAIGALWRSRRLLTIQSKLMFYFSLIQSKLLYGSNAYFPSITVGVLDRLIRLSKSAIGGFYDLSRWTPTSPTFLASGVCPLASAMTNKIVQFVHRCLIGRCSNLFSQYFIPVSSRATRGSSEQLLVVPFWPGPHGRASIQFYGAVTWNALPAALRGERDHSQFCAIIKCLP